MKREILRNRKPEAPWVRRTIRTGVFFLFFTSIFVAGASAAYDEAVPAQENVVQPEDYLKMALAQYHAQKFDAAQRHFETYIGLLPEKEQALYRDISPVVTKAETNKRLVEHYFRVAYARAHFSKKESPWDARGEVYVRLGAPNHISRSNDIQIARNPAIQDARYNFASRFYLGVAVIPGEPIFPVESLVRWEYWVYADVEGGTEFTFVDEYLGGRYTFAPVPEKASLTLSSDLHRFHGNLLLQNVHIP